MEVGKEVEGSGPSGEAPSEPKTALGVGDWVRILPEVKDLHVSDPYIVEDMVGMVGALYRVDAVDADLATVNGWAFRLEWLQRYLPEAAVSTPPPATEAPAEGSLALTAYREALVILLLKWGGRSEAHVQEEARFTVDQFLRQYPLPVAPSPEATP